MASLNRFTLIFCSLDPITCFAFYSALCKCTLYLINCNIPLSNMIKAKGVEYQKIQCPYDRSHIIDQCRFQLHLNRCRKSYKDIPLIECPFNVTHLLNEPELNWHVTVCPDRRSYENFKYNVATSASSVSPVTVLPEVETSENWDDEPDVPTYDPKSYCEKAAVLRLCQNAPPLERKVFRKAEHLRLRGMDDE